MTLPEALEAEKAQRGPDGGRTTTVAWRPAWTKAYYLFDYTDGTLGLAYVGQMAGVPPLIPITEEDRAADDWELRVLECWMD